MRKIVITLLLSFCVISCQKEDTFLDNETKQIPITQKDLISTVDLYSQREILEINLRWTAFITGSVLRNSTEAQNQVAMLLQNGNRVIKLQDLLIENTAFDVSFKSYLTDYLATGSNQVEPNGDKARPNPPPQGIDNGGHANTTMFFIDYILNQNCIELYFPKSLNFRNTYSISSTGHAMNDENFNAGIIRYYNQLPINNYDEHYSTDNVTINYTYVTNNKNIIIARPYRNSYESTPTNGQNCRYTQYNDIEYFTDFLNY